MSSFLSGKVAIVTGSSMGIGKSIARQLAQSGAKVVLNARNAQKLELAREELNNEGLEVIAIPADVSSYDDCQRLIDACVDAFGRLDILVNNAGVATRGSVDNLAPDVFQKVLDVNVLGSIYPSKIALSHIRQTGGSIIFISSIAAFHGLPYNSVYCASKKALIAFSESLRLEEQRHGVHVGIAYVGFTENDPKKIIMDSDGKLIYLENRKGIKKQTPEQVAGIIQRMIRNRTKTVTLSMAGKSLKLVQRFFPWLIAMIYKKNLTTIQANSEGKPEYVQSKN